MLSEVDFNKKKSNNNKKLQKKTFSKETAVSTHFFHRRNSKSSHIQGYMVEAMRDQKDIQNGSLSNKPAVLMNFVQHNKIDSKFCRLITCQGTLLHKTDTLRT